MRGHQGLQRLTYLASLTLLIVYEPNRIFFYSSVQSRTDGGYEIFFVIVLFLDFIHEERRREKFFFLLQSNFMPIV